MPTLRRNLQPLAELYARPPVDFVIEVARAVAEDFAARPARYGRVPGGVARLLEAFHERVGRDPEWPDKQQRSALYEALSGRPSGDPHPQTCLAEVAFLDAAEARATSYDGSLADAATTFGDFLRSCDGEAIRTADRLTGTVFARAAAVLGSEAVARAFGLRAPDAGAAGFVAPDIAAAMLVETITSELVPESTDVVPRYSFLSAQRFSAARREAVALVLQGKYRARGAEDALARGALAWARALRDFHADTVIRAWRFVKAAEVPGEIRRLGMPDNPVGWRLQLHSMLDVLACAAGGT